MQTEAGMAAVFMAVHPDPDQAMSDDPNSRALADLESVLTRLKQIDEVVKND